MRTRHVIVDNETLGLTPSAAFLTIAAIAVEIEDGRAVVLGRWYRKLQWGCDYIEADRSVDNDVIKWWLGQCDAAFDEAFEKDSRHIPTWLAMHSLRAWLALNPYPIWGNGSDFDNAQLQHAFNQHGLRWPYHRNRCLRSLKGLVLDMYPDTQLPAFPANKIKHHALHDAEHEADVLATLINVLGAHKEAA